MERKLIALAAGFALCVVAPLALHAQSQDQSASQQTDSVADAARKAREQKKESPKPKKVYTDDDVKPAQQLPPAQAPSTEGGPQQPAGQPASKGGQQPDQSSADANGTAKNDEASWRKRFAAQREKIARAEKELDILQREENKSELQYYSDPQKALTEQYTRHDINEKAAKIAAKQKEIADLKQQLTDMEDDLRKSGGDSGWSRP